MLCLPACTANMTNVYIVRGDGQPENYTALFAGAGFRYAQLSGLPAGHTATKSMLRGLRVHSNIGPSGSLTLPPMVGSSLGTHDVLTKIHEMTRASQTSNLWSIPTGAALRFICLPRTQNRTLKSSRELCDGVSLCMTVYVDM